ncbi:MAG: DUF983 domain-containing protein [Mesorhizobium sp.]|nr:DUF983 domain-containing protein [Mesorhizobium sp.]
MNTVEFGGEHHTGRPARALGPAMLRGFLGRCPRCGEGKLFRSFAKTVDDCAYCGEHIDHHRADDLPAYLVIFVVGHIVIGAFMGVEAAVELTAWQHLAIWAPVTVAMSIALLQPLKGAIVGLQWAFYMHGFGGEDEVLDSHPEI